MVIEANEIQNQCYKINDPSLDEDIEWLEKFIDKNIEYYKYVLNEGKKVRISDEIYLTGRTFKVCDVDKLSDVNNVKNKVLHREFLNHNFKKAFSTLKDKYKEYGWLVGLRSCGGECFPSLSLKKMKNTKSFWKSLFHKNKIITKQSCLDNMEKKYGINTNS